MTAESAAIVQRLWNYCNVLRDDGMSYGDYVEQLTYLLFLKMADERTKPPYNNTSSLPAGYDWPTLVDKSGPDLEVYYRQLLEELGKKPGTLGLIFRKSQNKIQDPAKLERLIMLINDETWLGMDIDIKGDIYEGLLQKNAEDVKGGAGQYFTPRPLIKAMIEVLKPKPGEKLCDPACGTGGFFLGHHSFIMAHHKLDKSQQEVLRERTYKGWEFVPGAARLCLMNLHLHAIGGEESPISVDDSLQSEPIEHFEIVATNPPFGRKSSITIVNKEGKAAKESLIYERPDFWATTSNKQLNFLQHVFSLLVQNGRAAIVVPDNVLFEGGAGETIRKRLLASADVHTLLRLPTGLFYAQGVKANVLFFDRKPAREKPWTDTLWIYDLRTNKNFTLKTNSLKYDDLEDFIKCYNPANRHKRKESERFKSFSYDELIQRDKVNLDIFWLKDESIEDTANLPDPKVLARDIVENLEAALEQFSSIYEELEGK